MITIAEGLTYYQEVQDKLPELIKLMEDYEEIKAQPRYPLICRNRRGKFSDEYREDMTKPPDMVDIIAVRRHPIYGRAILRHNIPWELFLNGTPEIMRRIKSEFEISFNMAVRKEEARTAKGFYA